MTPTDTEELPSFSHGIAGVAFALARLHEATGEARHRDAALAELMLSMHRLGGDDAHLALAEAIAADVVARATPVDGGGLAWIHAENRVEPWRQSYAGYPLPV